MKTLLILLTLVSCGTQKVEVEDSMHNVGGTTTSEIIIKFEPLYLTLACLIMF